MKFFYSLAIVLPSLVLFAQPHVQPCGLFEADGQPGYSDADFFYTVASWPALGESVSDFDSDGMVSILDLIRQNSCGPGLGRGLMGKYYGFEDGSPDQSIAMPNFAALTIEPTVVRVTETLDVVDGYSSFLDSDMRDQFAAEYDGYLYVPENAQYTLHTFAQSGVRIYLDEVQILDVDSWPWEDSATLNLTEGMHPIRIEFFVSDTASRLLLDWSSNGSIIGAQSEPISIEYFYHDDETVPEHAMTALELHFSPSSGTRTTSATLDADIFALSPDLDLRLWVGNTEVVPISGLHSDTLQLQPGLNSIPVRVEDSDGRTLETTYHIYSDREGHGNAGLAANLYAFEWHDSPMPSIEGREPFAVLTHTGAQLSADENGFSVIQGRQLHGGVTAHLKGVIRIDQAGNYRFRIQQRGALRINGELVSALDVEYPDQWRPEGEVRLDAGYHHFHLSNSEPYSGPHFQTYWALEDAAYTLIPDSAFSRGPNHRAEVRTLNPVATNGRVSSGLLGEYLFQPGAVFEDSSGNGFHLWHDPRAIPRDSGGVTYLTAGAMATEDGGVRMMQEIVDNNAFTIEVDFIDREPVADYRRRDLVLMTSATWEGYFGIFTHSDHISFWILDSEDVWHELDVDNAFVAGQRYHLAATFNGSRMRLYINGVIHEQNVNANITGFPPLAHFNVSQHYNRRGEPSTWELQTYGDFLAAACYSRVLNASEVENNRQRNLIINPTPAALPNPTPVDWPGAGVSAAQLDEAFHILNRLSFGPTIEEVTRILDMGADAWIAEQLNPDLIDDSEWNTLHANSPLHPEHFDRDMRAQMLLRATQSKRQLLEVITQFWENHFNTQVSKTDYLKREIEENQRFRELALGSFYELLLASAMDYTMTVYLDNNSNIVGAQNENFAREILELHTHGVNNGYTQADIVEAARCFTGWTVRNGQFYFDAGRHDYGEKNLLGITIPAGGGLSDGVTLIQHLASRVQTADFISWKLAQKFIADDPPADVVAAISNTFQNTDGDMLQVFETLFSHARFRTDLNYRRNKFKTPLEFVTSLVRLTGSYPVPVAMDSALRNMGMTLFDFPEPTGFSEEMVSWLDTNSMLTRWNFANQITSNRGNANAVSVPIDRLTRTYGGGTYSGILDFFDDLMTQGSEPAGARAVMESWITADNPGAFILNDDTIDGRIRQTLGLYLRIAEINKQ